MRKNVASQKIGAQMVSATDGSNFTGSVTVYVTIDAGTQAVGSVGSGACAHEGKGYHTYAPAQAETNGNLIAFTFEGTGAVTQTVQVETVSFDPHDLVRLGLTALPNANAEAAGGLFTRGTGAGQINQAANGQVDANATHFAGTAYATAAAALDDAVIAAIAALNNLSQANVRSALGMGSANLDTQIATLALSSDLATVLSRLSAARAGYLDFLNIGGNVASSAEVTAIQNNTRVVRVVPTVIERPDSGTTTYRIELFLYDDAGAMEAPDSAPTIALVNQAGTDLSSRLDSATMALVETGRYRAIYTASVGDTLEQLVWAFSVVEGGATRKYGNQSVIVDTTAVDFTAADRTKLDTLHDTRLTAARAALLDQLDPATAGTAAAEVDVLIARLTAIRAGLLDFLDAAITSRLATAGYTAPPSAAAVADAVHDEALSGHTTAGTAGKALADAATGSSPTAIADQVWDEILSGHAGAGSAGAAMSAAGGAADPLLNTVPGSYASGTAGAALGRIGSAQVTVVSPVSDDGTEVELIAGVDYLNANGQALVFTRDADAAEWPNLTGATVKFRTDAFDPITGTVVTPTGVGQSVRFDVVRTLTADLRRSVSRFFVEATLATSANEVPLILGKLTITRVP